MQIIWVDNSTASIGVNITNKTSVLSNQPIHCCERDFDRSKHLFFIILFVCSFDTSNISIPFQLHTKYHLWVKGMQSVSEYFLFVYNSESNIIWLHQYNFWRVKLHILNINMFAPLFSFSLLLLLSDALSGVYIFIHIAIHDKQNSLCNLMSLLKCQIYSRNYKR